jgi:FAD synthase
MLDWCVWVLSRRVCADDDVANLPDESLEPMTSVARPGIYFGYARVHFPEDKSSEEDRKVWPMVMSMGWNPYYKNEKLTAVSALCRKHEQQAH